MQPREFIFRLSLCPGLGPLSRVRLWRVAEQNYCFDNLELLTSQSQITPRVKESLLKNWASPYLDRLVEQNYRVPQITLLDPDYPAILREIYCPPLVLYYQGNRDLFKMPALAVVGSRQATSYGFTVLEKLIPSVVNHRITIVSGLARGIDSRSHEQTLASGGAVIGVIGTGLDQTYPRSNGALQAQVADQGLLLTEYPLQTPPLPSHFPARNRIIAGLCQTCLVVEAKQQSGSLITANLALQENRNVCAVPGPITSPTSLGTNKLISEGAQPILNSKDLLAEFDPWFEAEA